MPYIPHLNTIILEIPKSGSTSLAKAASTLGPVTHNGHLRASAYPVSADRIIAVVRDPIDRMVSAVNYYYPEQPMDDAMRHVLKYRMGQVAFRAQEWFMDAPGIEIYSLQEIDLALSSIGYTGHVPRENPSKKWLTREAALQNRLFMRAMDMQKLSSWPLCPSSQFRAIITPNH